MLNKLCWFQLTSDIYRKLSTQSELISTAVNQCFSFNDPWIASGKGANNLSNDKEKLLLGKVAKHHYLKCQQKLPLFPAKWFLIMENWPTKFTKRISFVKGLMILNKMMIDQMAFFSLKN